MRVATGKSVGASAPNMFSSAVFKSPGWTFTSPLKLTPA